MNVINVRENVIPRSRLQALPHPYHVRVTDGRRRVKALGSPHESVLLPPKARGRDWLLHTRVRGRRCTRTLRSHCRWRRRLLCLLRGGRARCGWLR
ncbi:UNVERIFIED_CONTAM: hypothetical protein K2H54_003581 [Gekko kuhli]